MKKKITIFMSVIAFGFGINANAQAVEEGNVLIDGYYGYPNFGANSANRTSGVTDIKVIGIGPAGLRAEFMVSSKFGIGVDFIYNSWSLTGVINDTLSNNVINPYKLTKSMQRLRPQIRMNFHFTSNEELDAYFGVGVGANVRKYDFKTDYPNYHDKNPSGALLPISLRLALGMRYFFSDNVGANLELGLGGPLISGGLSFKF